MHVHRHIKVGNTMLYFIHEMDCFCPFKLILHTAIGHHFHFVTSPGHMQCGYGWQLVNHKQHHTRIPYPRYYVAITVTPYFIGLTRFWTNSVNGLSANALVLCITELILVGKVNIGIICLLLMSLVIVVLNAAKSQNLNSSRLVWELSFANPLKPGVKSGMKM